jgi:hypothetical protein
MFLKARPWKSGLLFSLKNRRPIVPLTVRGVNYTVINPQSVTWRQGVTKRCRLSWLTKSALGEGRRRGGVAGPQPMSTWSPNKL